MAVSMDKATFEAAMAGNVVMKDLDLRTKVIKAFRGTHSVESAEAVFKEFHPGKLFKDFCKAVGVPLLPEEPL